MLCYVFFTIKKVLSEYFMSEERNSSQTKSTHKHKGKDG